MTQQKKSSKDSNQNKAPGKNQSERNLTKAEITLRDQIVDEAKKIAKQETSSAYGVLSKTRELLRVESELES